VYCVLMIFSVASCIWLPMMDLSALFHMQHDLALEQMVLFPTRGQNTLDLLFTSHPTIIDKCKALPALGRSDHDTVLIDLTIRSFLG
jgi:hypothetical protein